MGACITRGLKGLERRFWEVTFSGPFEQFFTAVHLETKDDCRGLSFGHIWRFIWSGDQGSLTILCIWSYMPVFEDCRNQIINFSRLRKNIVCEEWWSVLTLQYWEIKRQKCVRKCAGLSAFTPQFWKESFPSAQIHGRLDVSRDFYSQCLGADKRYNCERLVFLYPAASVKVDGLTRSSNDSDAGESCWRT